MLFCLNGCKSHDKARENDLPIACWHFNINEQDKCHIQLS